jgi:hypothetical protein
MMGWACRMYLGEDHAGFMWGKRQLGRPIRRWEGSIKMGFKKVGWAIMDWNVLVEDRNS